MTAKTVEQLLAGVIGLHACTVGPQTVAEAVKRRMAACHLTKESDYMECLHKAPAELSALIEMIVVPETWFFRDREPFIFLAQHAQKTWRHTNLHTRLRILSIPCSSGEEPYSITMTLQNAGLSSVRYQVDAMDINPVALRKAQAGVYGSNSFRSGLLPNCERYFNTDGATRIVKPEARAGIRFIHGNIMNPPWGSMEQAYDIIFCRNLLIYQHAAARAQIITTLDRLLNRNGLLFVGHAEMMPQLANLYEPISHRGTFAYYKKDTPPQLAARRPNQSALDSATGNGPEKVVAAKALPIEALKNLHSKAASPVKIPDNTGVAGARVQAPVTANRLGQVRALADQGRLQEAAVICRELLKTNPQLTEAHFMMGMIQTATGQVDAAEECLNRALYLDADYYEALIHLSLLKARRGDETGAARLRQHAERVLGQIKVTT